jgi:hypothetical protein
LGSQGCHRQISLISWNGKDPHRVGMEAPLFPSLNGDDGVSGLDDPELKGTLQAKAVKPD